VYQAGTFSGNPVAVAAGLAQLGVIARDGFYAELEDHTRTLAQGLLERGRRHGLDVSVHQQGAMMTLFFRSTPPRNFAEVEQSDQDRYRRYFHGMLAHGVFMPPSPFETAFMSAAHTDEDVQMTLEAADAVFRTL
jgi:glutamate-1-semialdehyde 2,1-aminomutase